MTALEAELLKVRTAPGLVLGAGAATAAFPLASLLVATTGGVGAAETLTSASTSGSLAGLLGWGLWAAASSAGEHAHGTITPSRIAVPGRRRLLGAQLVAAGGTAAAGALVSVLLALGLVRAVLPDDTYAVGRLWALLLVPVVAAAVAAVGVVVGRLTRSVAAAAATVAAALMVPKAAGGLLGVLERWVVGSSPGTVVTQLVGGAQLPAAQTHPGGPVGASATLLVVVALVVVVGGIALDRRDG